MQLVHHSHVRTTVHVRVLRRPSLARVVPNSVAHFVKHLLVGWDCNKLYFVYNNNLNVWINSDYIKTVVHWHRVKIKNEKLENVEKFD
jgi:hypothetical protein